MCGRDSEWKNHFFRFAHLSQYLVQSSWNHSLHMDLVNFLSCMVVEFNAANTTVVFCSDVHIIIIEFNIPRRI